MMGAMSLPPPRPQSLDVDKQRGLTVVWDDGRSSFYPVDHLRALSPSADAREQREQSQRNPLHVLPASAARKNDQPLSITDAELVGNYALRITFSDGHRTGIYSWQYLLGIDPNARST